MKLKNVLFPAAASAALAVISCAPESISGGATTNQSMPTIFMSGGEPARYARVTLFESGSRSMIPVDQIETDENGRFDPQQLEIPAKNGYYNVQIESDSEAVLIDSLLLSDSNRKALVDDTLAPTGSISGFVKIQKNHDLSAAVVHALGTNKFANVNKSGAYELKGLGKGEYALEFSVSAYDGKYGKIYKDTTVSAGQAVTCRDTVEITYFDIPVVSGVTALYDTVEASVSLSWNGVEYDQFRSYYVYRTDDYLNWPTIPTASVNDTFFRDTAIAFDTVSSSKKYWYRVAVQNKSGTAGLTFDEDSVLAVSPKTASTIFKTTVTHLGLNKKVTEVSVNDSVLIETAASNPTRKLSGIVYGDEKSSTKADSSVVYRSVKCLIAKDTLIVMKVFDNTGKMWIDSLPIRVADDAPKCVSLDSSVIMNSDDTLRAEFSREYGKIVSYKWKIGTNEFTTAVPQAPFKSSFGITPASVEAIDDDGKSTIRTFTAVTLLDWEKVGDAPKDIDNPFTAYKTGIMGVKINEGSPVIRLSLDLKQWETITPAIISSDTIFGASCIYAKCVELEGVLYLLCNWSNGNSWTAGTKYSCTIDKSLDMKTWERCGEWRTDETSTEYNYIANLTVFNGSLLLTGAEEKTIESKDGKTWKNSTLSLGMSDYTKYLEVSSAADKKRFVEYFSYHTGDEAIRPMRYNFWEADGSIKTYEYSIPVGQHNSLAISLFNGKVIHLEYDGSLWYFDEASERTHKVAESLSGTNVTSGQKFGSYSDGLYCILDNVIYKTK